MQSLKTIEKKLDNILQSDYDYEMNRAHGPLCEEMRMTYIGAAFTIRGEQINPGDQIRVVVYQRSSCEVFVAYNIPIFAGRVTGRQLSSDTPQTPLDVDTDVRKQFPTERSLMNISMDVAQQQISSVSFHFTTTTWLTTKIQ